jgi:hypothetical protein
MSCELRSARFGQSTLPAVGSRRTAALSLAELGDFTEGLGMGEDAVRIAEAGALAERLLKLSHTHIGRGYQAHAYRLLGDIAAHRNPRGVEKAQAHYCQAIALAEELGMRPLQAHCHYGLGTLSAQLGQREQARVELATAIDFYRAMEMTFWLPQAEAARKRDDHGERAFGRRSGAAWDVGRVACRAGPAHRCRPGDGQ